ncbi:MAG: hypothetical protein IPO07_26510 [Haliscomenobacter sp.]|nr:hypothetical protein [Haliscomenobacter sp.]MBK9491955.1 hypothetical protein [Haliscomenobacter sp.]
MPCLTARPQGFGLTRYANDDDKKKRNAPPTSCHSARLLDYAGEERRPSSNIPGADFKVKLTNYPPPGLACIGYLFSPKTNGLALPLKVHNMKAPSADSRWFPGFAGAKAKRKQKNAVVFAQEQKGAGAVVYIG